MPAPSHAPVAVLGAGPAGLTAAYVLAARGHRRYVSEDLEQIGLIDPEHAVAGVPICVPRSYPIYDSGYERAVATLRAYVSAARTASRQGLSVRGASVAGITTASVDGEALSAATRPVPARAGARRAA